MADFYMHIKVQEGVTGSIPANNAFWLFTIHGVHSLKCHYFGRLGVGALQQLLQVTAIIVAKDETFGAAISDALNH